MLKHRPPHMIMKRFKSTTLLEAKLNYDKNQPIFAEEINGLKLWNNSDSLLKRKEALFVDVSPLLWSFTHVFDDLLLINELEKWSNRVLKKRQPTWGAFVLDSVGSRQKKQQVIDKFRNKIKENNKKKETTVAAASKKIMMDDIKEDKKHVSSVILSEELEKEAMLLHVQNTAIIEQQEQEEEDKLNFKYKGNRIRCERRDIVEKASDRLRTISRLANFPILFLENSEADDVLATLANIALGFDSTSSITVVSPDKDFFQLLESPRVRLLRDFRYQTMSSEGFDFLKFKNDFDGIEPDMFVDYLALLGDAADNVPGVRGCGKVKALELLTTYGNLEEIFIAAQEKKIRGKLGEELAKSEHVAFLSKALLQLDCNLDLKIPNGFKNWEEALRTNF